MVVGNVFEWLMLIYSTWLIIKKQFTLGSYVAFKTYSQQFTLSVAKLVTFKVNLKKIEISKERIDNILNLKCEEKILETENRDLSYDTDINLKNVYFKYEGINEYVLEDCSAHFKGNKLYGVVGHSGCGKSTLLNLIVKLYDFDEGQITIGGINIKDISVETLRSNISYIQQDVYLFNGTIRENLTLNNVVVKQNCNTFV